MTFVNDIDDIEQLSDKSYGLLVVVEAVVANTF